MNHLTPPIDLAPQAANQKVIRRSRKEPGARKEPRARKEPSAKAGRRLQGEAGGPENKRAHGTAGATRKRKSAFGLAEFAGLGDTAFAAWVAGIPENKIASGGGGETVLKFL